MKKLWITLVIVLCLGVTLVPTMAQDEDRFDVLASYLPAHTEIFVATRIDDDFFVEMDNLIARVSSKLPAGALPPNFSIKEMLDSELTGNFGPEATFDNTFRPWLGDAMGMGMYALSSAMRSTPDMMVVFEITDRAAAEAFFDDAVTNGNGVKDSENSNDLWTRYLMGRDGFFAIGDNIALIAPRADLIPTHLDFSSLANSETYRQTLALLPEPAYNQVIYMDIQDFMGEMAETTKREFSQSGMPLTMIDAMMSIYENYPQMAVGVTLLNAEVLAVDFAQQPIDYSKLELDFVDESYSELLLNAPSINPDFLQRVPADSPFVAQGTNFGLYTDYALDGMAFMMELGAQTYVQQEMRNTFADNPLTDISARDVRVFVDFAFAGMTGLNLTNDVLPQMNGNSVFYGRALPVDDAYVLDTAMMVEVTDQDGFQNIFTHLVDALTQYEANFTQEGSVVTLPSFFGKWSEEMMAQDLDLVFGLSDDVFVIGTGAAAGYSLNPDADTLGNDATFSAASGYFVDGAQSLVYISMDRINSLLDNVIPTLSEYDARDAKSAQEFFSLFNSLAITGKASENGTVSRLALSLSE